MFSSPFTSVMVRVRDAQPGTGYETPGYKKFTVQNVWKNIKRKFNVHLKVDLDL